MLDRTKALAAIAKTFRVASVAWWVVEPPGGPIKRSIPIHPDSWGIKHAVLKGLPDNDLPMRLPTT